MTFKVDHLNGTTITWSTTAEGASYRQHPGYHPTFYVAAGDRQDLIDLRPRVAQQEAVVATEIEEWRTRWRNTGEPVLRVDTATVDDIRDTAYTVRHRMDPHQFELFNVDLQPQHRFCLDTGTAPTLDREPRTLRVDLPRDALSDGDISNLAIDGESIGGTATDILETLNHELKRADPDILVLSNATLVPLLYDTANDAGIDRFELGRLPGWQQLAGESRYTSYGQVGHSNARYNVPGRAIIDRSNCFWWTETNLKGVLDLVERSWKPVQELAWASIGNVLSSIEIRHALENDVLVPWRSWRHEFYKDMNTLHDADRGGFIFSPDVGVHDDVYECDFSSLYPNIMITRNISPETVQCSCCDNDAVPELDYSICEEQDGFLGDVLQPMIEERERMKAAIDEVEDADQRAAMQGKIDAIRWIGCACFGYQGFSNAKFGRIECHEAINAYARDILLETKEMFEEAGYRVLHGIIDSIWVQPVVDDPAPVREVAADISDTVGITLDFEHRYDWIAFCPRRNSDAGALTRYFGKVSG
ncbi:MAG: type B DNA-directed DNA polymerase, partial [Candidatus Nanohaloarchaea archaeon]